MLTAFKMRREGRRLARRVRQSILHDPDWRASDLCGVDLCGEEVDAGIESNGFAIGISTRRFRVFDRVNLYWNHQEVWLPLIARIRLRNATRLWLIRKAQLAWDATDRFEATDA